MKISHKVAGISLITAYTLSLIPQITQTNTAWAYRPNSRPICTIALMAPNRVIYQFVFLPQTDSAGKILVGGNGASRVYTPNPNAPHTGIEYIPVGTLIPYKAKQGDWHAYVGEVNGYKLSFQVGEEGGFAAYLRGRGQDLSATRGACK